MACRSVMPSEASTVVAKERTRVAKIATRILADVRS